MSFRQMSAKLCRQDSRELGFVNVPQEDGVPLDEVDVPLDARLLVDGVDARPLVALGVEPGQEAEDVLRQVPVVARVGVARHETGGDDEALAVERARGARQDAVGGDAVDLGRRDGRGLQHLIVVLERDARRRLGGGAVGLKGVQGEVVLLGDGADDVGELLLDARRPVADVDAVVDDDADALGERVDLDAALDDVRGHRGREEVLDLGAGPGGFPGQTVRLLLARLLAVGGGGGGGEEVAQVVRELGRVGGAALQLLEVRVAGDQLGLVGVRLDARDELGQDADARVRGRDGAVAAGGADDDLDVDVALLGRAGDGEVLAPLGVEAGPLVDEDGGAVLAVAVQQDGGEVAGAALARDLLVEAEGQHEGALRGEAGGDEQLDGLEDADEGVLAVHGAAAPDVGAVVGAAEGRVRPAVDGGGRDGHGVLVGHEDGGLQVGVGALPGVEEAVGVDAVELEGVVDPGEGLCEVGGEGEELVPAVVDADGAVVVEGLGGDLDGAGQAGDGLVAELGGVEVRVQLGEAGRVLGREERVDLTTSSGGGGAGRAVTVAAVAVTAGGGRRVE
ncbi:hypothetical protein CTA2_6602, partial [Colletotrichum tanaceti]